MVAWIARKMYQLGKIMMSVSLKIAGMLPMVCHFVTRIVPRVNVEGLSE
ncbi:hypothetical protein Hanom_Chr14g01310511 [Helianthus anomalus]